MSMAIVVVSFLLAACTNAVLGQHHHPSSMLRRRATRTSSEQQQQQQQHPNDNEPSGDEAAALVFHEFVLDVDKDLLFANHDAARMLGTQMSSMSVPTTVVVAAAAAGDEDDHDRNSASCHRVAAANARSKAIVDSNYNNLTTKTTIIHRTNGDEVEYGPNSEFPFVGNFHKTLPHDANGMVDVDAYRLLVQECINTIDNVANIASACSQVPGRGELANTLGGNYLPAQGIPPFALVLSPPPPVDSAELALMYAEVAWMALVRDVPFSQYDTNELVREAATSLSEFAFQSGIDNAAWKRPIGGDVGRRQSIDPSTQLFRLDFEGSTDGPMVSQFLHEPFQIDGIRVEPMITTIVPDSDTMTTFDEFLCIQNGGAPDCMDAPAQDATPRYIRNARDLGFVSQNDRVTSIYTRAASIQGILQPDISFYQSVNRHEGFSTQGVARINEQIVAAAAGVSPAFFSKWNVHRAIRPEAYGGLVEQTRIPTGIDFPIHSLLLDNVVIDKMVSKWGSALLPQINDRGCPNHPSYPAGHAMIAGACVTVLKAYMDPEGTRCYPFPIKQASPDGLSLDIVSANNDGPSCITVNGELNKLAHNLSLGRDMAGLHFRSDAVAGILQGEQYAISYLQDDLDRQPECATLKFKTFEGDLVELSPRRNDC